MALPDATNLGADVSPEWLTILHEEIDRLPEAERLPVVLCDLQGLTYEQAAEQLGWTDADAPLPAGEGPAAAQSAG